ncbi:MAG: hypothetical protein COV66_00755 [Nitrospinae bacterium CG11_big_fil_rev_8_21_14_0_20_45_15]|nr:MAG: hypothetical protein COV66_00755 [Nitrospinae bacterium CG11_big_fil_rev_8_21_14_0_20_45_15]
MNADAEGEGFIIQDNRSSQLSEDEIQKKDSPKKETSQESKKKEGSAGHSSHAEHFQIDFSTFILSLASTGFYHLGDTPDPATGQKTLNLPAVEQTIDMLKMLSKKTQGNLTKDEQTQLENLIYQLQMKYVEKTKKTTGSHAV